MISPSPGTNGSPAEGMFCPDGDRPQAAAIVTVPAIATIVNIRTPRMVIAITRSNYIKRLPVTTYREQRRGGIGVMQQRTVLRQQQQGQAQRKDCATRKSPEV